MELPVQPGPGNVDVFSLLLDSGPGSDTMDALSGLALSTLDFPEIPTTLADPVTSFHEDLTSFASPDPEPPFACFDSTPGEGMDEPGPSEEVHGDSPLSVSSSVSDVSSSSYVPSEGVSCTDPASPGSRSSRRTRTRRTPEDGVVVKQEPQEPQEPVVGVPRGVPGTHLRVLGVPDKSRVETQIKFCLQLFTDHTHSKVTVFKYLILPEQLVVGEGCRKRQQGKAEFEAADILAQSPHQTLILEARVVCASDPSREATRCFACVHRERKNAMRKRKNNGWDDTNSSVEEEHHRILQLHAPSVVDFSCGECIIPARITCYCRHHEERIGFRICLVVRDSQNNVIASTVTAPVMITDDHKPTKTSGSKRMRADVKDEDEGPMCDREDAQVTKVVPPEGPLTGGIEVTVLGTHFAPGDSVVFGEAESCATNFHNQGTLVCLLPPSHVAGAVPVMIKGIHHQDMVVTFTYNDDVDRALMELALQIIGMKFNGQVNDVRHIALQIVAQSPDSCDSLESFAVNSDGSGPREGITARPHRGPPTEDGLVFILSRVLGLTNAYPANVNIRRSSGLTMLHYAAFRGLASLIRLLLAYGGDLAAQDRNGMTPLHYAVLGDRPHCVQALMDAGARMDLIDMWHRTPRDLARAFGHDKCTVVLMPVANDVPLPRRHPSAPRPARLKEDRGRAASMGIPPRMRTGRVPMAAVPHFPLLGGMGRGHSRFVVALIATLMIVGVGTAVIGDGRTVSPSASHGGDTPTADRGRIPSMAPGPGFRMDAVPPESIRGVLLNGDPHPHPISPSARMRAELDDRSVVERTASLGPMEHTIPAAREGTGPTTKPVDDSAVEKKKLLGEARKRIFHNLVFPMPRNYGGAPERLGVEAKHSESGILNENSMEDVTMGTEMGEKEEEEKKEEEEEEEEKKEKEEEKKEEEEEKKEKEEEKEEKEKEKREKEEEGEKQGPKDNKTTKAKRRKPLPIAQP